MIAHCSLCVARSWVGRHCADMFVFCLFGWLGAGYEAHSAWAALAKALHQQVFASVARVPGSNRAGCCEWAG